MRVRPEHLQNSVAEPLPAAEAGKAELEQPSTFASGLRPALQKQDSATNE